MQDLSKFRSRTNPLILLETPENTIKNCPRCGDRMVDPDGLGYPFCPRCLEKNEQRERGDDDSIDSIGIPNVPWMVHVAQLERDRALLKQGICPRHRIPVDEETEECPYCKPGE